MIDILVVSHACLTAVNRAIYRRLASLGWKIELVIPTKIKLGSEYKEAEPEVKEDPLLHRLPLSSSHPRVYVFSGLTKLLDRLKPKIILLDNGPASILAVQLGAWAKSNNSKLVCLACDNLLPDIFQQIKQKQFKLALGAFVTHILSKMANSNIDHIFVISSDGENVMRNLGYKDRVSKIPLGYDPGLFHYAEELRNSTRRKLGLVQTTVAYFGRMSPEKGVHVLIKSLANIKDLSWQLLVDRFDTYRSQYCQSIQNLISINNLESRVVFFDAKHEEMPAYMNATDVVVVPSVTSANWKEQYGRVVPEAMACRKLIIASDCGALPELLGGTGLICPNNNVNELSELLRKVLLNPVMYKGLNIKAEQRAINFFSINTQLEIMNNIFTRICSS